MYDIPKSIRSAISKQQDKIYLLRLERDLISFINHSVLSNESTEKYGETHIIRAQYLKNSYYRLLNHQLCQLYRLQHWNNTSNEIIVSFTDGVDYQAMIKEMEVKNGLTQGILANLCSQPMNSERKESFQDINTHSPTKSTQIVKPKMLKKENSKSNDEIETLFEANLSESTDICSTLSTSKTGDTTVISTPISSEEVLLSSKPSRIESERASKEALYMQIREKIFQDHQDDDEDEEEMEEDDIESSSEQANVPSMDFDQDSVNSNGFNPPHFGYHPGPIPIPVPMPMPMEYNNIPPPPLIQGSYFNPHGHIPPQNMPVYPEFYSHSPTMPYPPSGFYNYPQIYDKDTERRLLNNPYIIIPDTAHSYEKKHKGNFKTNKFSDQNSKNDSSKQ